MNAILVEYARCSTDQQDLTAQRDGLTRLGVAPERIYVDHGLTGTNRERPGLREAACGVPRAARAEFESDLIRLRTREGMKVAKANVRLRACGTLSSKHTARTSTCEESSPVEEPAPAIPEPHVASMATTI